MVRLKYTRGTEIAHPRAAMYTDSRIYTDPEVVMAFMDPGWCERPLILKRTAYKHRSWKLLEKGMLLQVECMPFVEYDYKLENGFDVSQMSAERVREAKGTVPDILYPFNLDTPLPVFTQRGLLDYIHKFTERSIHLLEMDQKTAKFVWDNLGGVADYLLKKLKDGLLKFYKGPPCSPETYESIAIADFTDPGKPNLLLLVYGLLPLLWVPPQLGPSVYIPWKPCLELSEDAGDGDQEESAKRTWFIEEDSAAAEKKRKI